MKKLALILMLLLGARESCAQLGGGAYLSNGAGGWTPWLTLSNAGATGSTVPQVNLYQENIATATSYAVTNCVATVQAVNSFASGNVVRLLGWTSATAFNNLSVAILSTGLSGTQYEFTIPSASCIANVGSTSDTGTASMWVPATTASLFAGYLPVAGGTMTGNTLYSSLQVGAQTLRNAGLPTVLPESYGALGGSAWYFDGATVSSAAVATANGSTTTVTAPAVTTNVNNEVVLRIYSIYDAWSAVPSAGSGTQRVYLPYSTGYGMLVNDLPVATAGAVGTASGTQAAADGWTAQSISLVPVTGQTITYVSSTTASNSGTSLTINVPSGVSNGNFLLSCVSGYQIGAGGNQMIQPSAHLGQAYTLIANGTNPVTTCWRWIASSEPSSYTWNFTASHGEAGFIIAYSNVLGVDGSTLTSSTGGFTSASVGNDICIAGATSGGNQLCGTITVYTSSTQVSTDINTSSSLSGAWFNYGPDDTAAFQTMLSTAPCSTIGCRVALRDTMYSIGAGFLQPPANIAVSIEGAGPSVPTTENAYLLSGYTNPNLNSGSRLNCASTNNSMPLILAQGPTTVITSITGFFNLSGVALYGGSGKAGDGCGMDGVDVLNWQGSKVQNAEIANFVGNGYYVDGQSAASGAFTESNIVDFSYLFWNSGFGVKIGSTLGAPEIETTAITNTILENNGLPGLALFGTGNVSGVTAANDTIQWNNRRATAYTSEIYVTGSGIRGCSIKGNYIEYDSNGGSNSTSYVNTVGTNDGCTYDNNTRHPTEVAHLLLTPGQEVALSSSTVSGSSPGDYILPNAGFIRGANSANSSAIALIGETSGNKVTIDPTAQGATFGGTINGVTVTGTGTTGSITGTALTASCDSGTASVTGAVVGHFVGVSSTTGADVGGAFNVRASVTSSGTVTVYVCGTGTPASLAYNVTVF